MDFTNTKLAELNEDKRRLPRPKKRPVFNKGGHKHGERRKKSVTIFDSGKHKDNYEVYDERKDKWVSARNFKEDYDLDELIDGIMDETMRIPRTRQKDNWRRDVDQEAKSTGKSKKRVNIEMRNAEADKLRDAKKRGKSHYDFSKMIARDHNIHNRKTKYIKDDVELEETIDSIIDETKRMPRSYHKGTWQDEVDRDARDSRLSGNPKSKEQVNKDKRNFLAGELKNSRKGRGSQYNQAKNRLSHHRDAGVRQGHVESYEPLSASAALLAIQEKKGFGKCNCTGKCKCVENLKNKVKESALVLYGKYYNTNITEPTIAEQFKKRIDYCLANERDFDFLQSKVYVELFESLINERQKDYDEFIKTVEPQEDDLYKAEFTDDNVNNIVDEMMGSETIDNLMDKRAEEEIAYINDNYKQKLKMMGLL